MSDESQIHGPVKGYTIADVANDPRSRYFVGALGQQDHMRVAYSATGALEQVIENTWQVGLHEGETFESMSAFHTTSPGLVALSGYRFIDGLLQPAMYAVTARPMPGSDLAASIESSIVCFGLDVIAVTADTFTRTIPIPDDQDLVDAANAANAANAAIEANSDVSLRDQYVDGQPGVLQATMTMVSDAEVYSAWYRPYMMPTESSPTEWERGDLVQVEAPTLANGGGTFGAIMAGMAAAIECKHDAQRPSGEWVSEGNKTMASMARRAAQVGKTDLEFDRACRDAVTSLLGQKGYEAVDWIAYEADGGDLDLA